MKKTALVTVLVLASAGSLMARGLQGTKHDFSAAGNETWNTLAARGTNAMEICYPCHTPHGGNEEVGYLWNHQLSDPATLNTANAQLLNPLGKSAMCLGCHDGVTGLDSYAGVTNGAVVMTGDAAVGLDLADDHAIGVDYAAKSSGSGTNRYGQITWTGSTRAEVRSSFLVGGSTTGGLRLEVLATPDGTARIGCGTCHVAHDNDNGVFLRYPNYGSAICITCHGTKWDGIADH